MDLSHVELLNIKKMWSGHLCLQITERITWDEFPCYAEKLIKVLHGKIISRVDSPDIRIWDVSINGKKFQLIFDDYPLMVTLESIDDEADSEIKNIRTSLLKLRK